MITLFWKQWQRGYLRELCGRNNKSNLYFKGRYCANRDNNKYNRINWKMSRVTELIKGKDANVRAANVKYMKNYKKETIFQPINKLYPVELNNNEAKLRSNWNLHMKRTCPLLKLFTDHGVTREVLRKYMLYILVIL